MTKPLTSFSSSKALPRTQCEEETELSALALELAGGKLNALDGIWRLFGNDLYSVALWRSGSSADAEDAVQEVLVKLARRPGALSRARRPRAYLLRMVRNAAVDAVKRRTKGEMVQLEPDLVIFEPDLERVIDGQRIAAALPLLSAKMREVVLMRHLVDLSFREIGTVCGIPTFTAASRYRLAINRLRSILGVQP